MALNHEIIINNLPPDDTVCYSLLIVEGRIRTNPSTSCRSNRICIRSNSQTLPYEVTSGAFKGLVELKRGLNALTLTYCCSERSVNVSYTPPDTPFSVLPLYIICRGHDGEFQAPAGAANDVDSAGRRITLGMKLLQSVVAETLRAAGRGRKTFRVGGECATFQSAMRCEDARSMTQEQLWAELGREIIGADLGHATTKFLGFLSCTRYRGDKYEEHFTHDDVVGITEGYAALGGGGLALFGTACLHTWPEDLSQVVQKFQDTTRIDRTKFMDGSCHEATVGACFSSTLGAVLHELCHTLDLGHAERGVMGRDFGDVGRVFHPLENNDGTLWTESCVALLAHHRWLNEFKGSEVGSISFDRETGVVRCTKGLRVVEVRRERDEMVLESWTFPGRILKFSFRVPEDELKVFLGVEKVLVVGDNCGNVLKQVV